MQENLVKPDHVQLQLEIVMKLLRVAWQNDYPTGRDYKPDDCIVCYKFQFSGYASHHIL